jgi:Tfp pilus assembly protein PilW
MVFKITSTKPLRRQTAFLLAETMFGMGVVTLLVLAVIAFSVFSTRSFAAMFNYVDLDDRNRVAIDHLTRDVRQCNRVKSATQTRLVLEDSDLSEIVYEYDGTAKTLTRTQNGVVLTNLVECDRLTFNVAQRNTVQNSYDVYPVATSADTIKVVNVAWLCSRSLLKDLKENTESVQTARIVIRKQGS